MTLAGVRDDLRLLWIHGVAVHSGDLHGNSSFVFR
jgi:hypothetical protein